MHNFAKHSETLQYKYITRLFHFQGVSKWEKMEAEDKLGMFQPNIFELNSTALHENDIMGVVVASGSTG